MECRKKKLSMYFKLFVIIQKKISNVAFNLIYNYKHNKNIAIRSNIKLETPKQKKCLLQKNTIKKIISKLMRENFLNVTKNMKI